MKKMIITAIFALAVTTQAHAMDRWYGRVDAGYSFADDDGGIGSVGLGYHVTPEVRVEAVAGYRDVGGSDVTGFANAYYDVPVSAMVIPYVGGGIGASGDGFAWNGAVGVGIPTPWGMMFDVGYRYVDLGDARGSEIGVGVRVGF